MKSFLSRLRGPHEDLAGYWRGALVAVVAAVFLTVSGAFGTGDVPIVKRSLYWGVMMGLGYIWGAFAAGWFFHDGRRRTGEPWMDVLLASVVIAGPMTLIVWGVSRGLLGAKMPMAAIPLLFGPVLIISIAITAINVLIETRRAAVTHATPEPPKFLERLPLKLRGADVWAVEAEDHYLRLHTSKGQDLILMRLADAVAELEGIEGQQVHRSWWVARNAIADAKRGDGRATLTLKDGAQVPVSRTYAGLLRERGWI